MEEGPVRQRAFRALAYGLADSDPQRAAELYLEGEIDLDKEKIYSAITFGKYDGQNFGWGEIAKKLAVQDPLAAYEWGKSFTEGGSPGHLVTACAPASANATIDYFRDLPAEAFAGGTPTDPPYNWQPADLAQGLERITEIADPRARETAYAWLLSAGAANDPQAAIAAATESIGTPASRAPVLQNALASWAASDPSAASEWLAGLEPGSDRDAGIRGLVQASWLSDPDGTLEWAQQISDGETRQNQLIVVLRGQPRSWARDALESMELNDADRARIERMAQLNQEPE